MHGRASLRRVALRHRTRIARKARIGLGVLVASTLAFHPAPARASALEDALRDGGEIAAAGLSLTDAAAIARFQTAHGHRPLFVDEGGVTARGKALARALHEAAAEGLEAADYDLSALRTLAVSDDPAQRARAELAASALAIRYARDLAGGRLEPREAFSDAVLTPPAIDVEALLAALAEGDDVASAIASRLPARPQIDALREALARFRAEDATAPPWTLVPEGPALRPGDRDPRIPALRAALIDRGDLVADDRLAAPDLFDPVLADGVRRFQARHGLAADGVAGEATRGALAISRARRIEQLAMNLERERWFEAESGLHVDVNVPAFELEAVEAGRVRLRTRVIIGKRSTPTPIFADRIGWIELNPAWNVPRSIAQKEYGDDLRSDPGRMAESGYELIPRDGGPPLDPREIDWQTTRGFPFRLRQRPGEQNALGRLKFVFPNALSVYLHDTPARSLFERETRAFSHGCVRVQNPRALALVLLGTEGDWNEARLTNEIDTGKRQRVALPVSIPVRLVHRTAFVDDAGVLQWRTDLYDRDSRQLTVWAAHRGSAATATGPP